MAPQKSFVGLCCFFWDSSSRSNIQMLLNRLICTCMEW